MSYRRHHQTDVILKILVIGDSGVGKTNLITRYCENQFKDSYVATIGIDFKMKKFVFDNFSLRLQIWDTAGQQRFKNITNTFYKGAAGIMIAFSLTDAQSFQNVSTWVKQINNSAQEGVTQLLVGTKCDLQPQRKVSRAEAENLARKYNMKYVEVSGKTGINVEESFRELITSIKQKYDEMDQPIFTYHGVQITKRLEKTNQKCAC